MKRVAILGSTGSIGTQTLDIIRQHPDLLQVTALAAHANEALLEQQAELFGAKATALVARDGIESAIDIATRDDVDVVVVAVAGVVGLLPTIAAIQAGKHIALASKEVLVAAGEIVMPMVERHQVLLTPIDSEHSAIFQCLQGYRHDQIESLILTASGGPFRGKRRADLGEITVEQALNHPTWNMGGKITIDSATLMNKGLETIEARWLFGVELDKVEVVIHPQSIVHSFAKFRDGSVLGQLGWPNMKLPIQYALLYPERVPNELPAWNPLDSPSLTFEAVDHETFPSIRIAIASSKIGGTMPCAMNAANEEVANAFLRGEVGFLEIPEIVQRTMDEHKPVSASIESILEIDAWARETARNLMALNR